MTIPLSYMEKLSLRKVRVFVQAYIMSPIMSSDVRCGKFVVCDQGFPGGASGKEPAYQCRRHRRRAFDPWVGKTPWRRNESHNV